MSFDEGRVPGGGGEAGRASARGRAARLGGGGAGARRVRGRGRPGGDSGAAIEEMRAAGVLVFSDGGLDESTAVCSVAPSSDSPVFTDGPFVETKEHLGGFAVVDAPDDDHARYWAGRIAVAVGWPHEVHGF